MLVAKAVVLTFFADMIMFKALLISVYYRTPCQVIMVLKKVHGSTGLEFGMCRMIISKVGLHPRS